MQQILEWDRYLFLWINSHHTPVLDAILIPVSFAGEFGAIWIALCVALLVFGKPEQKNVALLLGITLFLVDRCIAAPLGHHLNRIRPYLELEGVQQIGIAWRTPSFPSGHAHSAWVSAVVLGTRWPRWRIPLVMFALLTCYSRPYLGMHYPLDVLAGWVLGIVAGFAALAVGRLWEKQRTCDADSLTSTTPDGCIHITNHSVSLSGLPCDLDGLRLIHLSDLHIGPSFRADRMRHVIGVTQNLRPDVVCITGDFVAYRSMRFVVDTAAELANLRPRLGTYAVLGNHDYWEGADAIRAALQNAGVRVLVNESIPIADGLWLAGVDDLTAGKPDLGGVARELRDDAAVVLLSHNPNILLHVGDKPWLVLAGHTHGVQVVLPLLGPRRTARLPFVRSLLYFNEWLGIVVHKGSREGISTHRYQHGWYDNNRTRMYVTRGVGAGRAFPFRINCPPEIACFTLMS